MDWEVVKLSLQADKKVKAGRIRFILPRCIGQVEITDQVSEAEIQRVLARITA
jgi:3-dehydroquinate synthase